MITAEERVKDKIAVAARDKLAASTKEKQLQAERKKKAAMFINLLRIVKESPMTGEKSKGDGDTGVCLVLVRVDVVLHFVDCFIPHCLFLPVAVAPSLHSLTYKCVFLLTCCASGH